MAHSEDQRKLGMAQSEERRYVVSTRYGGSGGDYWDDGLYHGVRGITLRCGKCIDSFGVLYYRDAEKIQAKGHGGTGGRGPITITLAPDECLKTVSGYVGAADWSPDKQVVIRSLKFETNLKTYGPFGEEVGDHGKFTFTVKHGEKIIGFFGRSGAWVDGIGFHVGRTI